MPHKLSSPRYVVIATGDTKELTDLMEKQMVYRKTTRLCNHSKPRKGSDIRDNE